ncbi:hypothetical protein FisN_34Hh049 [Fistulifera solaris]|jgi:hypothetical protein|uniref:FHA domain-containing protein n=1 Tax=Fistulifera solaris TaxID=1519565 RepID=A0A1Z5JBT7_FISSO|nr:hypothetical protein FisN_34Hh049 [Fistulifera solaris]|eukprot:GAX11231.1 hypothetical protein FisN_34Hh049 [Fistulifera solaris]
MTEEATKKRTLGGSTAVDAYCLIDGFLVREDDDTNGERVTIPVTRLPAIFGRDHEAAEPNHFFGIGTLKLFSREHFRIDYWSKGGRWGQTSSLDAFQWDNSMESSELMNPEDVDLDKPFFTITCLGKNGIFVQGRKVERDQSIVIKDRTAVKASSLCFYFLRPLHPEYRAISIPSNNAKPILVDNRDGDSVDSPPLKKRRGFGGLQAELDVLSTDELLEQFSTAIATSVWERRHQFVGSTISVRAVMAAAQSPELHALAAKSGDLERAEVMDWIAASERFSKWSQQMLMKLEAKSYQASITNAMIKVGFTRTAEKGRYIKWRLPQQIQHLGGAESPKPSPNTTPTNKTVSDNDSVDDNHSVDEKDDDKQLNVSNDGTLEDEMHVAQTGHNPTEENDKSNEEMEEVEEDKGE